MRNNPPCVRCAWNIYNFGLCLFQRFAHFIRLTNVLSFVSLVYIRTKFTWARENCINGIWLYSIHSLACLPPHTMHTRKWNRSKRWIRDWCVRAARKKRTVEPLRSAALLFLLLFFLLVSLSLCSLKKRMISSNSSYFAKHKKYPKFMLMALSKPINPKCWSFFLLVAAWLLVYARIAVGSIFVYFISSPFTSTFRFRSTTFQPFLSDADLLYCCYHKIAYIHFVVQRKCKRNLNSMKWNDVRVR